MRALLLLNYFLNAVMICLSFAFLNRLPLAVRDPALVMSVFPQGSWMYMDDILPQIPLPVSKNAYKPYKNRD